MNFLRFHYRPEDEWGGELYATLSANGFAGKGRAAFNTDDLREFASALSAYPLQADATPSIASGFGIDKDNLTQTHLAVAFHPHNARGELRVTVQLATEVWGLDTDLPCTLSASFLATYGDLDRFIPEFLDLLAERRDEATLQSSIE